MHGGNIKKFAMKIGKSEKSILDFSSNINPLGIPDSVASIYYDSLSSISHYPDPEVRELCEEIANRYSLSIDNIIAGNGSMSLIELVIRAIKPCHTLIVEPCFMEYRRLLEIYGAKVLSVRLSEKDGFRFSLSQIKSAMNNIEMMILGHPNSPTGTALEQKELLVLLNAAKKREIFVLVDEAFCDWHPHLSVSNMLEENSSFIVIRSLTKFYALAGIRAGFALGPKKIIKKMKAVQETWSCNALAQRLSIAALRDEKYAQDCMNWFRAESSYFFKALSEISSIKIYPSLTNFFLIKLLDKDKYSHLTQMLESNGIYLRNSDGFKGLNKYFFRIAIRRREENNFLLKIFKEALSVEELLTESALQY